jgi:hypothetical protein
MNDASTTAAGALADEIEVNPEILAALARVSRRK